MLGDRMKSFSSFVNLVIDIYKSSVNLAFM